MTHDTGNLGQDAPINGAAQNSPTDAVTNTSAGMPNKALDELFADSGDLLDPWKHARRGTTMLLGYTLVEGCGACPEDYDLFLGDERVAYLRLRHGKFRVELPHRPGAYIHVGNPEGDGSFANDEERESFLVWGALLADASRRERGETTPAKTVTEVSDLCALRARLRNTLSPYLVAGHEEAIRGA